MAIKPETIDEYLARLSIEKRAALEKLRKAIRAAAPRAEERISYQLPSFRLDGRMLVSFGAAANHCSFFPGPYPLIALKNELKAYDTSKGTIRFQPDSPLPAALVRKIVQARIAENADRRKKSGEGRTSRLKRPVHPMPDLVRKALKAKGLLAAYAARPPYQRNDYIGWITRAKLPVTKEKRLMQMLDELARGDTYMNMAYRPKTDINRK